MKKIMIAVSIMMMACVASAACYKVEADGAKSPYNGEDLKAGGYTFDKSKAPALIASKVETTKLVMTGAVVPCDGASCAGKKHITCD